MAAPCTCVRARGQHDQPVRPHCKTLSSVHFPVSNPTVESRCRARCMSTACPAFPCHAYPNGSSICTPISSMPSMRKPKIPARRAVGMWAKHPCTPVAASPPFHSCNKGLPKPSSPQLQQACAAEAGLTARPQARAPRASLTRQEDGGPAVGGPEREGQHEQPDQQEARGVAGVCTAGAGSMLRRRPQAAGSIRPEQQPCAQSCH